jgi:hypothetical protein
MLDLFNIPNSQQDVQIFYANGSAWQTWSKPRKCNYVWIMCIGGGAGGSGGGTGLGNTVLQNGGGSGGVTRALFQSNLLSDTLFVQVGAGGAGGVAGNSGSNGNRSFVSFYPNNAVNQNLVCTSGNSPAVGGNVNGLASAGETIATVANTTFLSLSNFIAIAGVTAPAISTTVTNVTPLTSQITSPGACGGWINASIVSTAGGNVLATPFSPLISGGTPGITGVDGGNGYTSWKPLFGVGGAGGAAATSGQVGSNGGNGGIGCGGGAAGQVNGGPTRGIGGRGGDGLVIIISF